MGSKKLWILIFLYIGFIYISLPFARPFLNYLYSFLGKELLSLLANLMLLTLFLYGIYRFRHREITNLILFIVPAVLLILVAMSLERPEERIHFIQYGILGFIVYKGFESVKTLKPVLVGGFIVMVGTVDEIIQWFLPNRVGDLRDVLFNSVGGLLGTWFAKVYYSY